LEKAPNNFSLIRLTPFLNWMVLIKTKAQSKIHFVIVVKNPIKITKKQNIGKISFNTFLFFCFLVNFVLLLSVPSVGTRVEYFHKVRTYHVVIVVKYVIESFSLRI